MDKIRWRGDKLGQVAGQLAHGCGRELHTSGSIGRLDVFKFAAAAFITTSFEHFAGRDSAGQELFQGPKTDDRNQIVPRRFKKCQLFCLHFAIPRVY